MNKITSHCAIIALLVLTGCHRHTAVHHTEKSILYDVLNMPLKTLNLNQLQRVFNYYKNTKDYQKQIACLERIILVSDDNQEIERCSLWLADIYAKQEDYSKAYTHYVQYGTLYPGSSHAAYAHMRSISTLFATSLAIDRDQSATRSTLQAVQSYLSKVEQNNKNYQQYKAYILSIAQQCADKLIEHELLIINFYRQQGNVTAAIARLQAVNQELDSLIGLASEECTQHIKEVRRVLQNDSAAV